MKYYTAEELKVMVYGENNSERHTKKYNETRAKLEDMPQEKFDELYAAFNNGSSGIVGGVGSRCKLSEEDVNVINKILQNLYHTHELTSVTDLCKTVEIGFFDAASSMFCPGYYDYLSNSVKYKVNTDMIRHFAAEVFKNLADQGEIEQLAVKTCGKVHIYLYRAK